MSILASLARAYERQENAPPFGFSIEKVGYLISLNDNGTPAALPVDLQDRQGKKALPRKMAVPASFKRPGTVPRPFFLWDNTAFALGISANPDKGCEARHRAFRDFHLERLAATNDAGLVALKLFLEKWSPGLFAQLGWPDDMKDQNVVFALESERRRNICIHDRPAAKALWAEIAAEGDRTMAVCLVSGETAPVARLHPAIKGVWGAQTSGASIVSFNLDAFASYGHEQGDNAPVSEAAAFAYTTALNGFLESTTNRIQVGDASTVFWADASDVAAGQEAEGIFAALFRGVDEQTQALKVGVMLEKIRRGQPLSEVAPQLEQGVRFYVLGLSPNAARLSVRFWLDDDFSGVMQHYRRFVEEMRIEPPPRDAAPALWKYLAETAALGKLENVPPNLAGEWMRAILTGRRYPLTLLSAVLMRLRADKTTNALRAAILKALLIRNFGREAPVALDPDNTDRGYLLGRLFAVYEHVQMAALGSKINATIKDKFYGAASAQPRKVFALLGKGVANHLSKVGKQSPGRKVNLERDIGAIMDQMKPDADPFPASLSPAEQALFGLGYYHQRNEVFRSKKETATVAEDR